MRQFNPKTKHVTQKSGVIDVNSNPHYTSHFTEIHPLHPYSEYKVTIKAIFANGGFDQHGRNEQRHDEIEILVNTSQSTPNIAPEYSQKQIVEDQTTLLFSWSRPSPMRCSNFNGKLKGFYRELMKTLMKNGYQIKQDMQMMDC